MCTSCCSYVLDFSPLVLFIQMEHMMHVKKLLDPNGILNPYKVLTDVASSL